MSIVVLLAGAASAGARERVAFVYERGGGAASCPDERELTEAIAARLGYDPFAEPAPPTMKNSDR